MVKPKHFLWLLAAAFALASCSGDGEGVQGRSGNANANSTVLAPEAGRLEFPKTRDDGRSIVVVHSTDGYGINYAVEWDCDKRAQRWTCYQMYASNSVTNWNRNKWDGAYWDGRYWNGDPFQEDPGLPEGCRTTLSDYRGSGYDRGHICPSADRLCSGRRRASWETPAARLQESALCCWRWHCRHRQRSLHQMTSNLP